MIRLMDVRGMAAMSVLVLAASTTNGQSADTLSYFPLEVGNSWSYITVFDPPNEARLRLVRNKHQVSR